MSDNLRLKGFDFVDWRIICHRCGETMDHLLLHCEKAHWLWSCVLIFWDFMGLTKNDSRYAFWLVELVGKALV